MNASDVAPNESQIILYADQSGKFRLDVRFDGDTVWLSQNMMAELYACSADNVGLHLKHIFQEKELDPDSVTENFPVTASDGKKCSVKHYNLDAIISVGYRVHTARATQFRLWATQTLKDYWIKQLREEDDGLKKPEVPFDYIEELIEEEFDKLNAKRKEVIMAMEREFSHAMVAFAKRFLIN